MKIKGNGKVSGTHKQLFPSWSWVSSFARRTIRSFVRDEPSIKADGRLDAVGENRKMCFLTGHIKCLFVFVYVLVRGNDHPVLRASFLPNFKSFHCLVRIKKKQWGPYYASHLNGPATSNFFPKPTLAFSWELGRTRRKSVAAKFPLF